MAADGLVMQSQGISNQLAQIGLTHWPLGDLNKNLDK